METGQRESGNKRLGAQMNGCAPADELVPPFPAHDLREVSVLDAAYFQWAAAVLASGIERPLRPPSALLVARRAVPRNEWRTSMKRFEFKVNGETFFSETQVVDVADILRIAYTGKAIGKDPDKHGFRLNVANSPQPSSSENRWTLRNSRFSGRFLLGSTVLQEE